MNIDEKVRHIDDFLLKVDTSKQPTLKYSKENVMSFRGNNSWISWITGSTNESNITRFKGNIDHYLGPAWQPGLLQTLSPNRPIVAKVLFGGITYLYKDDYEMIKTNWKQSFKETGSVNFENDVAKLHEYFNSHMHQLNDERKFATNAVYKKHFGYHNDQYEAFYLEKKDEFQHILRILDENKK